MPYTETQLGSQLAKIMRAQHALILPQLITTQLEGRRAALGVPGTPDWFVSSPQWSGFIEKKAYNGQLSQRQKAVIAKLVEHGNNVALVRFSSQDEVKPTSALLVTVFADRESMVVQEAVQAGQLLLWLHHHPSNPE